MDSEAPLLFVRFVLCDDGNERLEKVFKRSLSYKKSCVCTVFGSVFTAKVRFIDGEFRDLNIDFSASDLIEACVRFRLKSGRGVEIVVSDGVYVHVPASEFPDGAINTLSDISSSNQSNYVSLQKLLCLCPSQSVMEVMLHRIGHRLDYKDWFYAIILQKNTMIESLRMRSCDNLPTFHDILSRYIFDFCVESHCSVMPTHILSMQGDSFKALVEESPAFRRLCCAVDSCAVLLREWWGEDHTPIVA